MQRNLAIYFCGSIRAGRQDVDLYSRIIGKLEKYGEVLTPFVGDKSITIKGSEHTGGDKGIHDRDVELLQKSDGNYIIFLYSSFRESNNRHRQRLVAIFIVFLTDVLVKLGT